MKDREKGESGREAGGERQRGRHGQRLMETETARGTENEQRETVRDSGGNKEREIGTDTERQREGERDREGDRGRDEEEKGQRKRRGRDRERER